jgi:PAS domain S-box-containing protein
MTGIHKASGGSIVCSILALVSSSCERPVPSQPLTDISAVCRLSRDQAGRGYPVSLSGRVTFVDALGRVLVIEDGPACTRVDLALPVPRSLQAGNRVSVGGITTRGDVQPQVLGASLKVLDALTQLPPPQPLSASGIRSGALEYRRVAVVGVQRNRWLNRAGRVVIEVETPAGRFQATSFGEAQDAAPRWVGHRLRFTGVLRTVREATGGRLRTEIWVGAWQDVALDEPNGREAVQASGLPVLRTVAEIRRLSSTETPRGYPVWLRGTVTEPSLVVSAFFLQDSTGGIYARDIPAGMVPLPGDRVELQGHTVGGNFLTDVEIEHLRITGHGSLPPPTNGSLQEVLQGRHRAEWVAIEGIVRSVEPGEGSIPALSLVGVSLELLAEDARIPVRLTYPAGSLPSHLVAARVRALGVCASQYNQQRQFLGIRFEVPGPEFITVLEPAPAAPPPLRQMVQLLRALPGETPDQRVRVRGVVTLPPISEFGGFYLQDETGGAFVRARYGETLATGDEVEATGFPELGRMLPVVAATGYRKIGRGTDLAPAEILPEEAMRGDYDSQLVRIRGSLSTYVRAPRREVLTLRHGDTVFIASLDGVTAAPAMDTLRRGSLIEVTGVCVVDADRERFPVSFRVLLRSPRDVVTIVQAPWWNRDRALIALGFAGFAAMSVFAWVLLLRKRVREQTAAIALEKERYRLLVDHAPDIVFGSDLDGNLTSVNPAAERLLGYSQSELVGRNMWDLLPSGQREAGRETFRRLIAGESIAPQVCDIQVKDGGMLAVEINAGVVHKDLRPVAIHGILRDVTARLRLEEQLRQAQKMEAVGRLAGGVAHDFNNLLTIIMGNTLMLKGSLQGLGLSEFEEIEAVIEASETATDLTRQLLSYSGKAQVLVEPIDLSDCVRRLGTLLRAAVSKNVEIRLELAPDLPAVDSDRGQMKQIVTNLVLNSAEAIGDENPGVVRVTTRLRRLNGVQATDSITGARMPAGTYVTVEVSDTGCGMDAATASRIFDPFFTTKFTGRGLGLPAVAGAVKAHRGGIELETASGAGSRFCVLLPASSRCAMPPESVAEGVPGSGVVLVVDDEDLVRSLALKALAKCGYEVLAARDGREAIEVFDASADRIDAVLLDMSMPALGGKQALAAIRARRPSVPVVLMSGYSEEQTLGDSAGGSQLAFLHKPFTIAELSGAVRSVMPAPPDSAPPV